MPDFFLKTWSDTFVEVFWYRERCKNLGKKYFITVQKIHLLEKV